MYTFESTAIHAVSYTVFSILAEISALKPLLYDSFFTVEYTAPYWTYHFFAESTSKENADKIRDIFSEIFSQHQKSPIKMQLVEIDSYSYKKDTVALQIIICHS